VKEGLLRRIVFVLVACVALAGVAVVVAPASGQEAAPIFGVNISAGCRDWQLISVAREEADFKDLRAQLGNEVAIRAYREGRLPFPDARDFVFTRYAPLKEEHGIARARVGVATQIAMS
jgi:hypothetical protein